MPPKLAFTHRFLVPMCSDGFTSNKTCSAARPLQNAAFALINLFRPRDVSRRLQRIGALVTLAFFTPLKRCCDGGVPRKIFKIALQAPFFKGLAARNAYRGKRCQTGYPQQKNVCGKVFQAVGMALPQMVRQIYWLFFYKFGMGIVPKTFLCLVTTCFYGEIKISLLKPV